jgi:phosphoglycerate dehydrogenase-like enzyme
MTDLNDRRVRVGIDASLREELLEGYPPQVTFVRVPENPTELLDVDFWILSFHRKNVAEVFGRLRGVKVVQSMMAGVDWILPWLPKEIVLCDGRGIHDISTSEWVLSAVLAMLKRLPAYRDKQMRGEWRGWGDSGDELMDTGGANPDQYRVLGDDLSGKTVLIVGYGSIGHAIEQRMQPFGVKALRIARTARVEPEVHDTKSLDTLLPQADIVILIVPLTDETRGMIGKEELARMKRGALLVNASRGPVVVTDALVEALRARHIFAALDVTDPEPLPQDHPLWTAPNCLITPHIGGSTPEFIHRAYRFGAEQVRRYLAGEPLENRVTDAGY